MEEEKQTLEKEKEILKKAKHALGEKKEIWCKQKTELSGKRYKGVLVAQRELKRKDDGFSKSKNGLSNQQAETEGLPKEVEKCKRQGTSTFEEQVQLKIKVENLQKYHLNSRHLNLWRKRRR